ncbi:MULTISPECIES: ATP-dependent nuclease [Pseudomonas syringae group]|nr:MULTISPECIES: AAA family ATPase [Pseudomonas syringae group]MCF5199912.1 AAA family ATPase [Pseudomonas syringae]MCF5214970.1 AAA family ATPase [Pseudomonas syringae]MCF5220672.1 AAA family ATPase [Pseudomonas syringae]MCF5266646.1 AAA family ATPase [Pseudomonas syringae]MCF5305350.1 AAA family ATPase [Pseudomonas syringae]
MRVEQLKVKNFRGIKHLEWNLMAQSICCLIGVGDSAKTTVLDAVEAALSPRWMTFNEADFHHANTTEDIEIEVTIGELSRALLSDGRFGLYLRGLSVEGQLNDEPGDTDDPVLTVRLSVDATMEPVWSLVCDRYPVPRTLSNRDKAMFCLVRLAGDEARHLTWAQGSVLSKMTEANDETAQMLANAYRSARQSANLSSIPELARAATSAETAARSLGAYINESYNPDLELGRGGFSSGSIALHDGSVPLRLAGLGTRRLATLAVQRSAISEGAIVLVDEIEQGLEPHRVLGAMAQLKKWQKEAENAHLAKGQILMTTHSDVVLAELPAPSLFIVSRSSGAVSDIKHALASGDISRVLKGAPRALFARRILLCEGATELGLMLGVREHYPDRHGGVPIEQLGSAIIDGGGSAGPPLALALRALGYHVGLFRDSDRKLDAHFATKLQAQGVRVIEYGGKLNTERAVFQSANNIQIDSLLDLVAGFISEPTLMDHLEKGFPAIDVTDSFDEWDLVGDDANLRFRISDLAAEKSWFKTAERGRAISPIVLEIMNGSPASAIGVCFNTVENWLYGNA